MMDIPDTDLFELKITDLAFGGAGVGRHEGKVWFVPFTIPGETVTAQPLEEKKSHGKARLIEVLDSTPERVEPPCPYFGECGGCAYQHIAYAAQLRFKVEQVEALLKRVGGIAAPPMQPPIAAPQPYGYRNRITVHVRSGKVGFFRAGGDGIVDIQRCAIASDRVNTKLERFRRRRNLVDGPCPLRDFPDPRGFRQTNDAVAQLLLEHIDALLGPGGPALIDAYCGSGFIGHALAGKFKRVTGIDWSQPAIAAAREHAAANETYHEGDVAELLPDALAENEPDETTLVLDPPAEGLPREVSRILLQRPPASMVYVSCNPSTLARDAARLASKFQMVSTTIADMFPQTAEIECIAFFQRTTATTTGPT